MSDRDEPLERVVRELKRPVAASGGLDARIMAGVLAERGPAPLRRWWPLAGLAAAAGLAGLALLSRDSSRPGVAFTLVAPRASSVTVVGDFNDWNPTATPLTRTRSGAWETRLPLAPGQYSYAFVVDGSRWMPDPAAPRVSVDDFGSPNSVVTVPGASPVIARASLILAVLIPAALSGQGPDPRLDRLPAPVRAAVAPVIDSAQRAGLPTGPLVEKALEGTAKGASVQAIAGAVRALAGALAGARRSLGLPSTSDELAAGALALRLGARPEDLSRLRAARARGNLVVPLGVLSDLMARGVPTDTAARVVLALASQADDEYLAFRRRVDRDIDLGAAPVGSVIGALNSSGRAALSTPGKKP